VEKYRGCRLPPFVGEGMLGMLASSICRGRNAGNVGFLFTCTLAYLVLLGVQRFVFFYSGDLLL
jgi:hypothetical protein